MGEYEIRILRTDGGTAITTSEIQLSDKAAIRSGAKLAKGRKFQIWRGADCIFGAGAVVRTA